jgi:hypothetical protein
MSEIHPLTTTTAFKKNGAKMLLMTLYNPKNLGGVFYEKHRDFFRTFVPFFNWLGR